MLTCAALNPNMQHNYNITCLATKHGYTCADISTRCIYLQWNSKERKTRRCQRSDNYIQLLNAIVKLHNTKDLLIMHKYKTENRNYSAQRKIHNKEMKTALLQAADTRKDEK